MKVIFQDIDGVLYPCFQRSSLRMNADRVKQKLIERETAEKQHL